jgi:hypothetical protein
VIILLVVGFIVFAALSKPATVQDNSITTIDCGQYGPGIDGSADAKACFYQSFKECKPAIYSASFNLDKQGLVTYNYEITGRSGDLCSVNIENTNNSNKTYINKEMSCDMNNSKTFDVSSNLNGKDNCVGSLADLLYGATTTKKTGE